MAVLETFGSYFTSLRFRRYIDDMGILLRLWNYGSLWPFNKVVPVASRFIPSNITIGAVCR